MTIEQAKGVISERSGVDAEKAFAALRKYARDHNQRLVEVAEGVVDRTLEINAIAASPVRRPVSPPPANREGREEPGPS